MAKDFSSGEAKALASEHQRMGKELTETATRLQGKWLSFREKAGALDAGLFSQVMRKELLTGQRAEEDLKVVLRQIYEIREGESLSPKCEGLLKELNQEVTPALEALKPAMNPFVWLVTRGEKRERAREAYGFLKALSTGDYAEGIWRVRQGIASLEDASWEQVLSSFHNDKEGYRKTLLAFSGGAYAEGILPEIGDLLGKLSQTLGKRHLALRELEGAKQDVEGAVDQLAKEQTLEVLRQMDVEELNREKEGIRTKLLREAGYGNLADIHKADVFSLSAVKGISQEMAERCKEMTEQLSASLAQGAKVRLSLDHRTAGTTALVRALYVYRILEPGLTSFVKEAEAFQEAVKKPQEELLRYQNPYAWIFLEEADQEKARQAYGYLGKAMEQEEWALLRDRVQVRSSLALPEVTEIWKDFAQNSIAYFQTLEELVPGALGNEDSLYGLPEELFEAIRQEQVRTDGLTCPLREYQQLGVKYALHQGNVLLGDEMGLGKTVQAIAAMVSLRNNGATHFFVVCPASVLPNWVKEIGEKSDLVPLAVYGRERGQVLSAWLEKGGVAVTTYETTAKVTLPDDFRFALLVVDEAHYIKNESTKRSKNVRRLAGYANRLLFMTGTALENKVDEMLSLLSVLNPALAGEAGRLTALPSAQRFRDTISEVYYRRKREDVLKELPDKIESEEWCALGKEERLAYEASVMEGNYGKIRRVSFDIGDLSKSSKANRLRELCEEAEDEGRKVLVFSFFLATIAGVQRLLGEKCYGPITGSVPIKERQEIIDAFEKAEPGAVLLAQIIAGGTGLNIQSASVVILCEPQLKPSIENQAISRAYRMGQARNVLVYRLLAQNTVDEKIVELLQGKQRIFDAYADQSVAAQADEELLAAMEAESAREQAEKEEASIDGKTFGLIVRQEQERIQALRDDGGQQDLEEGQQDPEEEEQQG